MRLPVLLAIALLGGCAVRSTPYRFTGPLVGSVSAGQLSESRSETDPETDPETETDPGSGSGTDPESGSDHEHARDPRAIAKRTRLDRRPLVTTAPAPVRRTDASEVLTSAGASGDQLAIALRTMVGAHDDTSTDVDFVRAALGHIGAAVDGELADAMTPAAVLEIADARDARLRDAEAPRLGDLLVFDGAIGIVVSVDDRGVIEFVHLSRGVVRRGYACPRDPGTRRDDAGRVLNTILRHSDGGVRRGAPTRAGQLLTATISLARLLRYSTGALPGWWNGRHVALKMP